MSAIRESELRKAIVSSGFGTAALRFLLHPRFQDAEVNYKLRLARKLGDAREALFNKDQVWTKLLRKAVNSQDDNIINWRVRESILLWCEADAKISQKALRQLWNDKLPLDRRIVRFSKVLASIGLSQPGTQLSVTSVLLMATNAIDCPPVRARVLTNTLKKLGLPKIKASASVPERYDLFMAILDGLVDFSRDSARPLKNRLEAQGITWCGTGGWGGMELPADFEGTTTDYERDAEADIAAAAVDLSHVKPTERKVLIAARRGQGQYRNRLLRLWAGCAVTGCTRENLLRASHLMPWRDSSNVERLDQFNGLLLTPTLDLALDRRLISFDDQGKILISSEIRADEAEALGLSGKMRLRFVRSQHKPYLAFHRNLFRKREAQVTSRARRVYS